MDVGLIRRQERNQPSGLSGSPNDVNSEVTIEPVQHLVMEGDIPDPDHNPALPLSGA
jgi:hypothetical protein